jgi:hypothetical protein
LRDYKFNSKILSAFKALCPYRIRKTISTFQIFFHLLR